jgi:hypothetical protein
VITDRSTLPRLVGGRGLDRHHVREAVLGVHEPGPPEKTHREAAARIPDVTRSRPASPAVPWPPTPPGYPAIRTGLALSGLSPELGNRKGAPHFALSARPTRKRRGRLRYTEADLREPPTSGSWSTLAIAEMVGEPARSHRLTRPEAAMEMFAAYSVKPS